MPTINGKMVHHWSVLLDFKGMIYVNEHAQLQNEDTALNIGDMLKMHAALIETAHVRALGMIEKHSDTVEEAVEARAFLHDCIKAAADKQGDREIAALLAERDTEDFDAESDPLTGLALVVERARLLTMDSDSTDGPVQDLREALAGIGVVVS